MGLKLKQQFITGCNSSLFGILCSQIILLFNSPSGAPKVWVVSGSALYLDSICSGAGTHHIDGVHGLVGQRGHRTRACGSVSSPVRRGQVPQGEGCVVLHTEGLCRGARGRAVPGQQMGLWLLFPGPSYLTTSSLHEQLFRSLHWDATRAAIFLPFFALYTV